MLCVIWRMFLFQNALSWMPYMCMVAVLSYVLVYGFGLGPIPYFIASGKFRINIFLFYNISATLIKL